MVVAVGGEHGATNMKNAGVCAELEEALGRGKPGFVVAGFGGSVADYCEEDEEVFSRLRNGLSREQNRTFAESKDIDGLVRTIISDLKLLPLIRQSLPSGRMFRILALDGGGLRGVFTAAVLAKWDDMIKTGGGNDLVKHFDLVAGTSTGQSSQLALV